MSSENKTIVTDSDLPYWAAFSYCRNLGSVRLRKVATTFPTLKDAWEAPLSEFQQLGFEEGVLGEIDARRRELDPLAVWERVQKEGLNLIPITHPDYPALLNEIFAPPSFLYARGNIASPKDEIAIAVVGTRRITPYGEQVTEMLVRPLAKNGCTIVSGLAYGVDARAHEITLEEKCRTVAVLGCGLDRASVYPSNHRYLADKITEEGGCVVSEHAPGTPPLKHHFPYRNRIIAGLSRATLVIEAPEGSGALTTAMHALEFNRDVLAVPGNITSPNAFGTNKLLKIGAIPVTAAEDIFSALNLSELKGTLDIKQKLPDTEEESKLLEVLAPDDPLHIDMAAQNAGLIPSTAASALTMLELKGMVKNVGGMRYIRLL